LVDSLIKVMGDAYPELSKSKPQIEKILLQEEEQFARTLDKGMRLLEQDITGLKGSQIPGKTVFTLYDTYGFPVDLTNDIARERGLTLDYDGFNSAMEAQRERARSASKFDIDYNEEIALEGSTDFTGYTELATSSQIVAVLTEEGAQRELSVGQQGVMVLDTTPFYAESGGQAGDTGSIVCDGGEFVVTDTQKQGQQFLHVGHVIQGTFLAGMSVTTHVNSQKRSATAINHSATHLLHAALREILGEHVVQKGSLVNDERLRFDFAHFEAVTDAQLWQLEQRVAGQIRANTEVTTTLTDMTCAQEMGAMALFGEKYGEQVRVLSMGEEAFSVELCGGIHVQRTGDIGQFIIVSEGGISSGVRRIEALTGDAASAYAHENLHQLKQLSTTLKCGRESVLDKSLAQAEKMRLLEKELEKLKSKIAASAGDDLACMAVDVDGIKVVAQQVEGLDRKAMMDAVDKLKNQLSEAVVLLAAEESGKLALIAGVTKSISKRFPAGELMKEVAVIVDGKGGGRPDMAQGGGSDLTKLDEALARVQVWVGNRV